MESLDKAMYGFDATPSDIEKIYHETFAAVIKGYRKHWFHWLFPSYRELALIDAAGQARINANFVAVMVRRNAIMKRYPL